MAKQLEEALVHALEGARDWMLASAPGWLRPVSVVLWNIILFLFALYVLVETYNKCRKLLSEVWPRFSEAERERNRQRRKFCAFLRTQIDILNRSIRWSEATVWNDENYAELEAEIEAEGARSSESVVGWLFHREGGLRREKSLTEAIRRTRERLVILEGDAGSGKTVALRHVVSELAKEAERSYSNEKLIAIYVNLKTLERGPNENIDAALIESHVQRSCNELGYADVKRFVVEELRRGLARGSLTLLFDSFDEIPEILSATDANDAIREYGVAIDAFMGQIGAARAVVASRPFRGPKRLGWPVFRILPLSRERQLHLIKLLGLTEDVETRLLGDLENARLEIQTIAENPLFLRLLAEHARSGRSFPQNVFEVFETFVTTRLAADAARIQLAFDVNPESLRGFAEDVAFEMNFGSEFGLSPRHDNLVELLSRKGFGTAAAIDGYLAALCATNLATRQGGDSRLSFAHRRLQEYFATCVVLKRSKILSPATLIADGRWRETAVALLQTQDASNIQGLIETAAGTLEEMCTKVSADSVVSPRSWRPDRSPKWFPWPDRALHLMGLLQDGLGARGHLVPPQIRECVARLASAAVETGTTLDCKWALETAGLASSPFFENLLRYGLLSEVELLKDAAYRQAAHLRVVPFDLAFSIRRMLLRIAFAMPPKRSWAGTFTYLRRLDGGGTFVQLAKLLRLAAYFDLALALVTLLLFAAGTLSHNLLGIAEGVGIAIWLFLNRLPQNKGDFDCVPAYQKRACLRFGVLSLVSAFAMRHVRHPLLVAGATFLFPIFPAWFCISAVGYTEFEDVPPQRLWCFLPFRWTKGWVLGTLPTAAKSVPGTVARSLFSFLKQAALYVLILGVIGLITLMLGSLGFYTTRRVFVTALVAAFVYGIWEITKPWVLDIWQLGRAAARVKFTNREFLQMLSGFHAEKSAYRFVRSCRLARKVEQTHDSFRSVSELLLAMDGGAYDASVLPNISTSIHRWNGPMLMSEMARLYEQLSLSPDVLLFPPQIR